MNATFAFGSFAFEAPIFNPPTNELFFSSVVLPPESSMTHNNHISKIDMALVERELASGVKDINVPFTVVSPDLFVLKCIEILNVDPSFLSPKLCKSRTGEQAPSEAHYFLQPVAEQSYHLPWYC